MVNPTSSLGSARSGSVGHLKVDDPSAWEESSAPWDLVATPLDAYRNFENHKFYLVTPSITLYREIFTTGLHLCGLSPPQMLALTVPLHPGSRTSYWKRPPTGDEIPAALHGGLDVVVDGGDENITLLVSLELLQHDMPGDHLSHLLAAGANRKLSASTAKIERFARWQEQTLNFAMKHPDALQNEAVLCTLQEDLLQLLGELAATELDIPTTADRRLGRRGLKKALDYIHSGAAEHVTIPKLCAVACVSQRTLEYAFNDALGLSPRDYLRRRKLHAARQSLLSAIPGHDHVGDIALRHGFLHMGRFAVNYKALFDELPSQTLDRPSTLVATPLIAADRASA